jgi:hypothetical protein
LAVTPVFAGGLWSTSDEQQHGECEAGTGLSAITVTVAMAKVH